MTAEQTLTKTFLSKETKHALSQLVSLEGIDPQDVPQSRLLKLWRVKYSLERFRKQIEAFPPSYTMQKLEVDLPSLINSRVSSFCVQPIHGKMKPFFCGGDSGL